MFLVSIIFLQIINTLLPPCMTTTYYYAAVSVVRYVDAKGDADGNSPVVRRLLAHGHGSETNTLATGSARPGARYARRRRAPLLH